ncbi:unnamed protein product, partial [Polarella glacialis]
VEPEATEAKRRAAEAERNLAERARKDAENAEKRADLQAKLQAALDESEQLGAKLYRAQERIRELKDEIKEWKRKCGIDPGDSDDEEDDEDDLPAYLLRYTIRTKNSGKPRWQLLNE